MNRRSQLLLSQILVRRVRPYNQIVPYILHAHERGDEQLESELITSALLTNIYVGILDPEMLSGEHRRSLDA